VLQKLEARGAALRIAGDETVRYSPVAPEEFLQRIDDQFQTPEGWLAYLRRLLRSEANRSSRLQLNDRSSAGT
jgi:sugar-specific transcriptional regulator TrmB